MALAAGTRFGAYEITGELGVGGMGEVYRAIDTALERPVAIKILPEAFATDAARIARLEREAKILAALNHVNIAQIYGIERSGGTTALVMELVDGQTLADRIARGPIAPNEALDIAMQIADALEAAHERGIVHRDLKPANIKLRADGTVKVLDFGIAKALDAHAALPESSAPAASAPSMTQAGSLLGTAAYMSPEQARGRPVDQRTDIWAFGCVLYELLTSQSAFGGEDATTTLARVLERDPVLSALPAGIAPVIRQTIGLCLRKDAKERIADIRDVKLALKGEFAMAREPRRTGIAWLVAAAAILATVMLAAALYISPPEPQQPSLQLSMSLPEGWTLATSSNLGEPTPFVVSPDGKHIAIVARHGDGPTTILLRDIDSAAARPLAGTEGATSLFWSPDSSRIGFFAADKIETIGTSGGRLTVVCDAAPPFLGGTWGANDTIVFSTPEDGTFKLWKVAAGGGEPTHALTAAAPADGARGYEARPWFLPDGRTLLYVPASLAGSTQIYAAVLDSPDRVRVGSTESSNVQFAQGQLLYLRGDALVAQPFDEKRLAVTGDPVPIAGHVSRHGARPGYGLFSASANGLLAYYAGADSRAGTQLTWVDRQGKALATVGDRANYRGIALSHDGERAAAVVGTPGNLYIVDLAKGVTSQFTFEAGASFPAWSVDDSFIAFGGVRNRLPAAYRKPSNGAGTAELFFPNDQSVSLPFDLSKNGDLLYVGPPKAGALGVDLWVLPGAPGGTPFRLADNSDDKRIGKFSPNGRWVAYVSYGAGGQSVWVVPVVERTGAGGVKWRVSAEDGGSLPLWRSDGRELYYVSGNNILTAVQVETDGSAFQVGQSKALFPISVEQLEGGYAGWSYAVSNDGQRFLVMLSAAGGAAESVSIELNWTARLGK